MRLSFPTSNPNDVAVIIEDKNDPSLAIAKRTLVNLPDSWDIDYIDHIPQRVGLGIDINYRLNMLCGDAILDIDFDHVDEEAYARYKAQYWFRIYRRDFTVDARGRSYSDYENHATACASDDFLSCYY